MKFKVKFREGYRFDVKFSDNFHITPGGSDDGYTKGYEEGHKKGYTDGHSTGLAEGYANGYAEGLAARTYEVWTITLADGNVIEKEVALL